MPHILQTLYIQISQQTAKAQTDTESNHMSHLHIKYTNANNPSGVKNDVKLI